ncbi:MAG: GtrA family protein [Hyphomonadaceae bacterium]
MVIRTILGRDQLILEQFGQGWCDVQPAGARGVIEAATTRPSFAEFAQFIAIGAAAAGVNLVARYLLNFTMPFEAAVIIAYVVGMVAGFAMFQVFIYRGASILQSHRMVRFAWVNLFGATLAWTVSIVMARQLLPILGWTWHPLEIAHLAGVAAPALCSYFLNKYYTFA